MQRSDDIKRPSSTAPMLGGMLTVTVLNLVVVSVIYSLVLQYQEKAKNSVAGVQEASA